MKKIKLLFLLCTTYAIATTTPRLDTVENNNRALAFKLEESQKVLMQQELNNKNLESKISELKSELEKLKNTQDDYRIEKSSYDFKMQSNTDLVASQDKRLNDIMLYFTLFLGLFGIGTYLKAKQEAKETAQDTAKEFITEWIKNSATPHLNTKISKVLKTKDDEIDDLIEGQIKDRVEPMLSSVKASLKDVEAHVDRAKTHVDELDKLSLKAKENFKEVSEEELEKIEAKEVTTLTAKEHYKLGVSAVSDGKFNTALNEFENAIRLSDEDSFELGDIFFAKGFVLGELKEYDQAIEVYQRAVKINPNDYKAYNNMGSAYSNTKEYDKAIEAYKKAIEINPKKDEPYYNMGIAYGNKKEYGKAIEAYEKAVAINPKKGEAYHNMGIAYGKKEEYDKAIESYIKALNINSNNSSAYTNLFELQLTQNQPFDQALERKYSELFQNQKESFIHYEMLKILQSIVQNQEVNLAEWVQKYNGVSLGSWSFDELREWIDGVEDKAIQMKLREALEIFEGHE